MFVCYSLQLIYTAQSYSHGLATYHLSGPVVPFVQQTLLAGHNLESSRVCLSLSYQRAPPRKQEREQAAVVSRQ